jgi:hypothetical protein
MRWKGLCTIGLMATVGSPLQADWKITTVSKSPSWQSIQTEYYKGTLHRTEWSDQNGKHKHVQVLDRGNGRLTDWDIDSRRYTVHPLNPPNPAAKSLPAGPIITIDRATTDTSERRTFFGRTARHLITHERSSQFDGETVIDGWYIDLDGLPSTRREAVLVAVRSDQAQGPPVFKVNQTGAKPTGLAVLLKTNSTHVETTSEVTELKEGRLPDDLFEPPPGFVRPIQFPDHLRLTWERLQDWVASLFP